VAQRRRLPSDAPELRTFAYLQQALAIAKFEPGIYDVVETYASADNPTG
jgi:hypothetical protein